MCSSSSAPRLPAALLRDTKVELKLLAEL